MFRTELEWVSVYEQKKALWTHNGDMSLPHAELTSGLHSDGFFNSRLVTSDETILRQSASDLVELYQNYGNDLTVIDGIVGSQTGATKLAQYIRDQVSVLSGHDYFFFASPQKCEIDGQKAMCFKDGEVKDLKSRRVLLCEDVCTTGGSVELTAQAVERHGGTVLPVVLTLVNRSGESYLNEREVIALINHKMEKWEPEVCPLCKLGSKAILPKDNWKLLTGKG